MRFVLNKGKRGEYWWGAVTDDARLMAVSAPYTSEESCVDDPIE